MAAKIIPFPRVKPLGREELPDFWPESKRNLYAYWTYDGYMSHQEAFDHIDEQVRIERAALVAGQDPTVALIRAAVARLPRR